MESCIFPLVVFAVIGQIEAAAYEMRYDEVHQEKKQLNKKLQDVTKKCEESEMEVERLRKAYENQSQWWWKRRSTTKSSPCEEKRVERKEFEKNDKELATVLQDLKKKFMETCVSMKNAKSRQECEKQWNLR